MAGARRVSCTYRDRVPRDWGGAYGRRDLLFLGKAASSRKLLLAGGVLGNRRASIGGPGAERRTLWI
ncbi:hypothetical protein Ate02nite_86530 [Paractinoplanes tereljensis]|uniref:Uncharacterized protein n=1 Tax=Paractinoplanes tereljensis TaxID=571912 RepID=A0A919TWF6_9ACTN|nr:hypothetical protein Ate02nite_86530 [Actinoplanes tereljensis]